MFPHIPPSAMVAVVCIATFVAFLVRGRCGEVLVRDFMFPDVSVTTEEIHICTAIPIQSGYITRFQTIAPGRPHMHLFVMGCTRPGLPVHMIRPGRPYVWDCGSIYPQDRREETMPQAPFCDQSGDGLLLSGFDARQPEYELKIPDGVGFAVGPQFGYDFLTLSLHVVQLENSGWTGETGIRISMVPTDNSDIPFRGMGFLTLTVRGSVPPHSVGTVCGSFHVPAVMHPISFSIHYHRYGRGGSASHIDGHGRETVFLSQNVTDPALDFSNKNFTLRPGDQLRVQCVYNNTTPETIHVLQEEMCILQFFYYVDGDRGDLPDTCDLEYGKPQDCTKLFLKHLI